MKTQIRRNVFETNSSSAHSIVVTKNDTHVKPEDFKNGFERIYLHNGTWEIAWDADDLMFERYPMNILTTVEDKARYVFADYCGYSPSDEKVQEITEVLKRIIPGLEKIEFPKETKVTYEHEDGTPVDETIPVHIDWDNHTYYYLKDGEKIFVKESENTYHKVNNYGHVDHQSQGIIDGFIKKMGISLEEFLTNRKYVICIDGDEYDFWGKFKYSGLIDTSNIVLEYGGYN